MFDLKSDLNLCNRLEVAASSAVADAASRQGSWITLAGVLTEDGTANRANYLVWSESNRDNTAGFTPDVKDTGALTVLSGYFIGWTTPYTGSIAIGDLLVCTADGKLVAATSDDAAASDTTNKAVAVAMSVHDTSHKYVGGSYDSVKIMSL